MFHEKKSGCAHCMVSNNLSMSKLLIAIVFLNLFSSFPLRAFELGIGTHITYYKNDSYYYMDLLKKYGFTSFRDELPWTNVEVDDQIYRVPHNRSKNDQFFRLSKSRSNIAPMFLLVYGHKEYTQSGYPNTPEEIDKFVNYAKWIAERYKGKVKYYEIWNEWLQGTGIPYKLHYTRPDSSVYLSLIKKTSEAIKKIDPNAIVITGSFSPMSVKNKQWIYQLIDNGLLDYIDGLSIHPYSYHNANKKLRTPEGNLQAIDKFENEIELRYKKKVPLYITEMGIPNYSGEGGLSANDVGVFAVKYTLMAKSREYIKGIWWYDLVDDGNDSKNKENRFGFFKTDSSPKPAATFFYKYKNIIKDCYVLNYVGNEKSVIVCGKKVENINLDNDYFLQNLDHINNSINY